MSFLVGVSILLRMLATSWSVVLIRRTRDWRMGYLTVLLALMTLRQALGIRERLELDEPPETTTLVVGLAVSVLALLAVAFLARLIAAGRQAQMNLRRRNAELESIFEVHPDLYFRTAPDGTIREYRASRKSLLYVAPDEFLGKRMQDVLPPDLGSRFAEALERVVTTGEMETLEYPLEVAEGERIFESRLMRLPSGELISVVRDITDRKLKDEALREREARLQMLASQVPGVLWTTDTELHFTSSTGAALDQLGLRPGQVVGMSLYDYFQTRDPAFEPIAKHRGALQGETGTYELVWEDTVFATRVEPLHDEHGRITGTIGFALDISVRKRAEKKLREREQRLRVLTAQVPGILWTTDTDLRITSSTGAGLKDIGIEPDQGVGMLIQERLGTDDPAYEPVAMHMRALSGESARFSGEFGGHFFEAYMEPLLAEDGSVRGAIGFALNISERKKAEEALVKSREQLRNLATRLQSVREEERALIAREIHDEFGQTLTGLKLDLAWIAGHLPEQAKELQMRVRSLMSLVETALDSARYLSSRLHPAVLDELGLEAAIEAHAEDFARRTGIECALNLEAGDLGFDKDRDRSVYRILQEALTNVARHAEARRVELSLRRTPEGLVARVRDDGRGITDDELWGSRSLGLIGMRERAGAQGGRVEIHRGAGGGTVVEVRMPIAS